MEKLIRLSDIRIDGGTQPRTVIDEELVSEYSNCVDALPPITVFHDGVKYWLADGFHRYHAHNRANLSEINCIVINGTERCYIALCWCQCLPREKKNQRR